MIIAELKPMSEAPKDGSRVLAVTAGSETFFEAYFYEKSWHLEGASLLLKDNHFTGWVPMPIYQPLKIVG